MPPTIRIPWPESQLAALRPNSRTISTPTRQFFPYPPPAPSLSRPFLAPSSSSRFSSLHKPPAHPPPSPSRSPHPSHPRRPFTSTSAHLKKRNKSPQQQQTPPTASSSSSSPSTSIPDNAAQRTRDTGGDAEADPFDFSELEAGIARAVAKLGEALGRVRSAGRVSAEAIEGLSVVLKEGRSGAGAGAGAGARESVVRLGDVATVVPKGGRSVMVVVGEEGHLKPTLSALLSSPHSLTPTPDPTNPLLALQIPIPPPTAESRALAAAEAKKSAERASMAVRDARGDAQKRFRRMELARRVGRDELRRAHAEMEKVAERGQREVKGLLEGAVRGLER